MSSSNGQASAADVLNYRYVLAAAFFVVMEATVWALIQDSPFGLRLAMLPPSALAFLFFSLGVREQNQTKRRLFDIIAVVCGLIYLALICYACVYWYQVPTSFWIRLAVGTALGFPTIVFLTSIIALVVAYQAEHINAGLFWPIMGMFCVVTTVLGIGIVMIWSIRQDIERYVRPRHLEPEAMTKISAYLQKFPAHEVSICTPDPQNSETTSYSGDIFTAIYHGGWTVNPRATPDLPGYLPDLLGHGGQPIMPDAPVSQAQLFRSLGAALSLLVNRLSPAQEGITLDVRTPENGGPSRKPPDPRNPDAGALLRAALEEGGIELSGGSGGSTGPGVKEEKVVLTIGHRPRTQFAPQ